MIIKFNGGKMIVEHPSGHIDSYNTEQVTALKDRVVSYIADLQAQVSEYERTILAIQASQD